MIQTNGAISMRLANHFRLKKTMNTALSSLNAARSNAVMVQ
jgi:hypothetical protein